MKPGGTLKIIVLSIAVLSAISSITGIFSDGGRGEYLYESIRGERIMIYGRGIYHHMSSEVAIQGIAQDYVTLIIGIPLILLSLHFSLKGSVKWRFILLGTLGYFFVTYLFYMVMAMYNQLFLLYSALMGASFFGLIIGSLAFKSETLSGYSLQAKQGNVGAYFLIINSIVIALLWLSIVVPPLAEGTIYPKALEHYTTLIVQGIDLGLLLPLSFVSGYLFLKKNFFGFLMAPSYLVFLSLLMTALNAKIIYLGIMGYNVFPAVFIIPILAIASIFCAYLLLKPIKNNV
jgi:hypothetical protein